MENKDVFAGSFAKILWVCNTSVILQKFKDSIHVAAACACTRSTFFVRLVSIVAGIKIHAQIFDDIVIIKSTR